MKKKTQNKHISVKKIQQLYSRTQLVLIASLALTLGMASIFLNIHFENDKVNQNLQNMAEAIASSPILTGSDTAVESHTLRDYLDTLKDTLNNIDVISVVDTNHIRLYHSNPELIGTVYDGNLPKFKTHSNGYYAVDESGPSGHQRRSYAAIYNTEGEYIGFVMTIMLTKNINAEISQMLWTFFLITVVAILIALIVTREFSYRFKQSLLGYEPDVFAAMYKMRDNILETIDEGILAVDNEGIIQFANNSARQMLCKNPDEEIIYQSIDVIGDSALSANMRSENKDSNIALNETDIILDCIPIKDDGQTIGMIAILHNRAEYTKLMEDLAGTQYLVDSMRANNHDFTNKLHVILGLIQMEMYEEATSYIQNITMVQRENISRVMNAVSEPAVAALLIGKIARASELNINFVLREDCCYSSADMNLPSEMLVTVIGNLLDNAFDAMNDENNLTTKNELIFGIYSTPDAMLITVDDTGHGICKSNLEHIFENGYSTKGDNRGTGLYQVKKLIENFGGVITVESQENVGSSFCVKFSRRNENV